MQLSSTVANRIFTHSERMGETVEMTMAIALDHAMDWYYLAADARTDVCANRSIIGYGAYIWNAAAREIANRNEVRLEWLNSILD